MGVRVPSLLPRRTVVYNSFATFEYPPGDFLTIANYETPTPNHTAVI
jgi:hypothetical protein